MRFHLFRISLAISARFCVFEYLAVTLNFRSTLSAHHPEPLASARRPRTNSPSDVETIGSCYTYSWVHESRVYSITFDETTDVSHTSQSSLLRRYVHKNVVQEDFVYPRSDSDAVDANVTEPILTGRVLGEQV
ncbi:hypothetical protein HPB49_015240 [Dermacentor silvarum]|uniref:Uncharacterized protein n=1 Tax=Dermacentor silvarum TaxID=543639 RepID=A0ACB8E206_DERSI|nr:hypothetical protein HPB49_015240 [Dermacentor silvarum]